jgi:hypothetical protein
MIRIRYGHCTSCKNSLVVPLYIVTDKYQTPQVGLCEMHYWQNRASVPSINQELEAWYRAKISICKWRCENCEARLWSRDWKFKKACQAHLLPKSLFDTVATHPDNYACLGATCGCHSKYDSNWDNARKLKIWPELEQRIVPLVPLLTVSEYRKLPEFLQIINAA